MSTRYGSLLVVAALIGSAAGVSGCYTRLLHPRLAEINYQRPDSKQCGNCHSSEQIWSFNHTWKKPDYSGGRGNWIDYYDTPWWYEKGWKFDPRAGARPDKNDQPERGKNEKSESE
jgi:hypothetical protein